MVTVLVTRPRSSSERLAAEFKRHGFDSIIEPLLTLETLSAPPPDIDLVQATMITSANVLDALEVGEYDTAALFDLPCFCVGSRTGKRAREFGFRDVRNSTGDGDDLAQLITGVLKDKSRPILHIAAQDVDSKVREALKKAGYTVFGWVIYKAEPVPILAEETVRQFKQRKLDAVVVFSVRTAEVLKQLLSQHGLETCCESLSAIGLSEAVADALRVLPWRKRVAAHAPTEDAVIECLKQLHPVA